jgi:hypothetical protein
MEGDVRVAEVLSGASSHPSMNKAISGAQADRNAKLIVEAVNNYKPNTKLGFINTETDIFALYMEDNVMELGFWESEAARLGNYPHKAHVLANDLKEFYEKKAESLRLNSFFDMLLAASLKKVDWTQIAETLILQAEV